MATIAIGLVFFISILICHYFAKQRGGNPVYLAVMGAIFGPFAIPFVLISKPKDKM